MNLKWLLLLWDLIHLVAPWRDLDRPVKCGRDFMEKGSFSELDKEDLLKEFCATSTAEYILAKYFHQGVRSLCKARGGDILKTLHPK